MAPKMAELAPSPRQQMYIQRLYLYLNMTKPSKWLYLSYAKVNSSGKSIRPAYLIEVVQNLFPGLSVDCPQNRPITEQIVNPAQGRAFLAGALREYAEGSLRRESETDFYTVYQVYGERAVCADRNRLAKAAFARYKDSGISRMVARLLYGNRLYNSVTRLETFAACAYRHFLQYGLSLKERQEFGFENVDMGNVYHAVLETFDTVIGLDRLCAIHLNDSKNPLGAAKDRHEKIGEGFLGLEGIARVINHPLISHLPFYLETPNELDGYAAEIALLRSHYRE